jgi:hypothetical protein
MLDLTLVRHRTDEPLPPQWLGALSMTAVIGSFLWLLAYTWGVMPAGNALGQWNYVACVGLLGGGAGGLELWRYLH